MSVMKDQKTTSVPNSINKKNKKRLGFTKTLILALGAAIGLGSGAAIIDRGNDFKKDLINTSSQVQVQKSISRAEISQKIVDFISGKYNDNISKKEEIKQGIILQNPMLKKWNTKAHDNSELEVYSKQINKDLTLMQRIIINGNEFTLK